MRTVLVLRQGSPRCALEIQPSNPFHTRPKGNFLPAERFSKTHAKATTRPATKGAVAAGNNESSSSTYIAKK